MDLDRVNMAVGVLGALLAVLIIAGALVVGVLHADSVEIQRQHTYQRQVVACQSVADQQLRVVCIQAVNH